MIFYLSDNEDNDDDDDDDIDNDDKCHFLPWHDAGDFEQWLYLFHTTGCQCMPDFLIYWLQVKIMWTNLFKINFQ